MSTPRNPRSRRARPAKAALSRDLIVETALDLLKREGYEATSMRRVAQALDTGPASLYVYVANRDELLELMLDRAVSTVPLPIADPAHWREQLKDMLKAMGRILSEDYPGITRFALGTISTGPGALALVESMRSLMKAGGMSDQAAGFACDILDLYVQAQALESALYLERTDGTESFGDQRFDVGLDVLLNGLLATPFEGRLGRSF